MSAPHLPQVDPTRPANGSSHEALNLPARLVLAALGHIAAPWVALSLHRQNPSLRAALTVLGFLALVLGMLAAEDPRSFLAALPVLGVAALFTAWDARGSFMNLVGSVGFGSLVTISIYISVMSQYPDWFFRHWSMISATETLSEVRALLLWSAIGWGLGTTGLFGLSAPLSARLAKFRIASDSIPRPIMIVGVLAFALTTAVQGVDYMAQNLLPASIANTVNTLVTFYSIAFFGTIFLAIQGRASRSVALGWFAVVLIAAFFSGSKGRFFTLVLLPASVIFALARQRISGRAFSVFAAICAVSALVVYPLLSEYRTEVASSQGDTALEMMATASERADLDYVDKVLRPFVDANTAEQCLAMTSVVFYRVTRPPEDALLRQFFFWVPRFVWPDKPETLSGNAIGRETQRVAPEDLATSVLITGPGELYIYFGAIGGLALLLPAFLLRLLEEAFCAHPTSGPIPAGLLIHLCTLATTCIAGNYEASVTGLIQQSVVLIVFLRFSSTRLLETQGSSIGAIAQERG